MSNLTGILRSRATYRVLLALNALAALAIMWATRNTLFGDHGNYLALAEGILQGRYSPVWHLEGFHPDTLRTPGFPLYIATLLALFGTWKAIMPWQAVLYALSIHCMFVVMDRNGERYVQRNLFLLLLLPLVNVPWYITQLAPEIPALAAISAIALVEGRRHLSIAAAVALGLLYGFLFQCKPVTLFLPFAMAGVAWWYQRGAFPVAARALALGVFLLTLLPYGLWNRAHHGAFSVTPLEGGGGVMHMGYWSGLIPGHKERHYWGNFTARELVPFAAPGDVAANVAAFEAEWGEVHAALEPHLSEADRAMIAARGTHLWGTFSSGYTLARERELKRRTIERIRENPGYYLRYKLYSAVRLWVVGLDPDEFRTAPMGGRMRMLFPTLLTLALFLLTLVLVPLALLRGRLRGAAVWPVLLPLVYFGIIHLPFVIQTRYTISVRMLQLALLAMACWSLWERRPPAAGRQAATP